MVAYSWLLCLFVLAMLSSNVATIKVPASYIAKANASQPALPSNATIMGDSELSASERNRRLIPYMAFYVPSQDFPINQQYAVQKPLKQRVPATSGGASEHSPPVRIAIPPTYMQIKLPTGAPSAAPAEYPIPSLVQAQPQTQYHPNAGTDGYHAIAFGQSIPIVGLKEVAKQPQLLAHHHHTLPAGPVAVNTNGASDGTSYIAYKPLNAHKHKTVQHFPPLSHQQQQQPQLQLHRHPQQQQQQQYQQSQLQQQSFHDSGAPPVPLYQRQRTKQSKTNLTPFTAENTVPGHFVPIIYTPVSSSGSNSEVSGFITNNNNNNEHQNNGNTINYNYNEPPASIAFATEAQSHHKNAQRQQQQHEILSQQQIAISPKPTQYITPTEPAFATHPTASLPPIYHHVFNEPSAPASSLASVSPAEIYSAVTASAPSGSKQQQQQRHPAHHHAHQQQLLMMQQQQQQQQQRQKPSTTTPPKYEHQSQFFNAEPQQQYLHAEQMTPQEKYVMYLHQRMRFQKHQQQRAKEQYLQQHQQQQQQSVYIDRPTLEASADAGNIILGKNIGHKYAQHNAVGHVSLPEMEEVSAPKQSNRVPQMKLQQTQAQQQQQQPQQQVLHIPLKALIGNMNELQHEQPLPTTQQQQQLHAHSLQTQQTYVKDGTGIPPQYIDYIIDGPKQTLEEDKSHRPSTGTQPIHRPPPNPRPQADAPAPPGYIVVTTASPHVGQQHQHVLAMRPPNHQVPQQATSSPMKVQQYYSSTQQPLIYQNSPKLRLQALTTPTFAPTRSPATIFVSTPTPTIHSPTNTIEITPKNNYVSLKPNFKNNGAPNPATSTNAIKLKPSYKFNTVPVPMTTKPDVQPKPNPVLVDDSELPDIHTSSLAEILHKLQASNHLPQTLTPDNIDNSIKTLIKILQNLKQSQTIHNNPPQHHDDEPIQHASLPDYDYGPTTGNEGVPPVDVAAIHDDAQLTGITPNKHPGPSTGRPGIDYPNYASIPSTSFDCGEQRYKGFFGDPETNCQVWHYCDLNGGKASFLCPNGTIFSQIALTCDWWFNVKCSTTAQLYVLNERLYKYILPFTPKFPEDYNGPIVDKYLAMKFQEMEEKMRLEKLKKNKQQSTDDTDDGTVVATEHTDNHIEEDTTTTTTTTTAKQTLKTDNKPQHVSINSQVGEQSSERNLLIDDEIDDISERGSFDTYQSTPTAPLNVTTAELPLSLRPIVVSSTPDSILDDNEEEYKLQSLRDTTEQQLTPKQTRETTKVSVEKLEVIEIKTDGNTGHLMPIDGADNTATIYSESGEDGNNSSSSSGDEEQASKQ